MASSNLPGMHLAAGLQAHNLGDIEAAAAAYRRALAFAPEHADALHLLGVALMQLGDAKTAVGFLERAAHQQGGGSTGPGGPGGGPPHHRPAGICRPTPPPRRNSTAST